MTRLKDWPSRFAALVEESRARAFAWGTFDCCLWGSDSVQAITGRDPAAQWRGTYDDALSAARLLASLGGIEAAAALAGSEVPPLMAQVGDVGTLSAGADDGSLSIGVCAGDHWLVVTDAGLASFPMSAATRAWRAE